ncbi:MAG: glycosyl hydrolase-related protein [Clostridia bacterium]|nr:glycosyl hydrolase-related protein [Clostridia bacterium]
MAMNQNAYIERTYTKFDNILELYAAKMFREIGRAETVDSLMTAEHLRVPPEASLCKPAAPGTKWGGEYENIWLETEFTVPAEADGKMLCAIPEAEAVEILCFRNGKPAGIINSKNNFLGGMHSAFFVDKCAKAGTTYKLAFECYAGHTAYGCYPYENYGADETKPFGNFDHTYHGIRFAIVDELMRDFVFDLATVLQMARLKDNNFLALRAHEALMNAFPYLIGDVNVADDEDLHEACAVMREKLAPALAKTEHPETMRGHVGVIGHSHMDTAWLWPVSETIRKCARTYSETLNLMDIYPDYTFIQSSALHLEWMKDYYPEIFEGIKQKVAEGRYEPNGGVWVECDCNITGGEAMVRQFLYGQRFTEKELGYRSDAFWLPDTFGYNGAIPQIMHGAGVKYFYTTKMSWADLNHFPADTFLWRGIDGTEVLTHLNVMHLMPDVTTLTRAVGDIRDKHSADRRLAAYGFGDGGGGPTFGQLEFLSRTKDLPGMPEIHPVTASSFMQELEADRDRLPVYDGELYLELHRGTLTSMHEVKQNNRQAEIALYEMELFNVLSGKPTADSHDVLYKTLLKNQFHDILPGTCITKVYDIAIPEMRKMIADTKEITAGFVDSMTKADNSVMSFYNPLAFDRDDIAVIDGALGLDGMETQVYTDMEGCEKTAAAVRIPAMEAACAMKTAPAAAASVFKADGNTLVTPYYDVVFDEAGSIASLVDKRVPGGREVRNPAGAPLGTLWFGENMPSAWDNWEIEDDIFKKLSPVTSLISRDVVSDGCVEYRVRAQYKIGKKSSAIIDTVFYAKNPRIDFEMKIDWHERHHLIKAGFDVNVRSATFKNEIQFGHVDRPTTRNTPLEAAKFEVCNHKWSDISETRYGVAVLNNGKYGISCEGSDMRLTIVQGGCRPDPITDYGVHKTVYSLLPHVGSFDADTVVKPAYALNVPAMAVSGILHAPKLFSISAPGIICEAVKNAEDRENAYVLRLYECERNAANCTLTVPGAKHVYVSNLLEEVSGELEIKDGVVVLPAFRPFEIKTIIVER